MEPEVETSCASSAAAAAPLPPLPPHFATLDAAAEAAALGALAAAPPAFGSKKRRREATRASRPCHEFAASGSCAYGAACKYAHGEALEAAPEAQGRAAMRALALRREQLFVGGGESGDGGAASAPSAPAHAPAAPLPAAAAAAGFTALERMVGPTVTPMSMVRRYYTRLFAPGVSPPGGAAPPGWDAYVYLQANCVAVVGLAPSHALLHAASPVTSVAFAALPGTVWGKAPWVEADTVIALATTADGRAWPLRAGVRGTLTEPNPRRAAEPHLLRAHAATRGHLAVITLHAKRVLEATQGLLGEADFTALCRARGLPGPSD